MRTCTVHEPPDPAADRIDRGESLVFVKDGFSWLAALFTPLWLLAHRLWWPFLGYVLLSGGLSLLGQLALPDTRWTGLATLALNLLIGFEADSLRRWDLSRRGWTMLGTVTGRSMLQCERRFYDAWLPTQPIFATTRSAAAPGSGWRRAGGLIGAR